MAVPKNKNHLHLLDYQLNTKNSSKYAKQLLHQLLRYFVFLRELKFSERAIFSQKDNAKMPAICDTVKGQIQA